MIGGRRNPGYDAKGSHGQADFLSPVDEQMSPKAVPADTLPEAAQVQLAAYRRMAPARRLELAMGMSDALREIAMAGVRSRHPEYSDEQVRLAYMRLTLGKEQFSKIRPGVDIEV